jgi:uncharacterized membrane protein (UPF0127 family)
MAEFLSPLLRSSGHALGLRHVRTGEMLATRLEAAFDSKARRTGLLGRDSLPSGTGLVIAPCSSIHTFFMRFPIDVVFVTRDGRVAKICRHMTPWRIAVAVTAFSVIELPAGSLDSSAIVRGDSLAIVAHEL